MPCRDPARTLEETVGDTQTEQWRVRRDHRDQDAGRHGPRRGPASWPVCCRAQSAAHCCTSLAARSAYCRLSSV